MCNPPSLTVFRMFPSGEINLIHLFSASQTIRFPWAFNDIPRGCLSNSPPWTDCMYSPLDPKSDILLLSLLQTKIWPSLSANSPFGHLKWKCWNALLKTPFSLKTTIRSLLISLTMMSWFDLFTVTPQGLFNILPSKAPSPMNLRGKKERFRISMDGNSLIFSPFILIVNKYCPVLLGMKENV